MNVIAKIMLPILSAVSLHWNCANDI